MKTQDERIRYVIQHKENGLFLNVMNEMSNDFMKATRWKDEYEINLFLNGYYKPDNPEQYRPVKITITYELGDQIET
ncbi:hypothetical protein [Paenibacillus odorifer]|uniref:hypothetical protein n=1 Tax=Paenibacillus odorifer TaxID=189426 RepID=UPI00096E6561|nr:hypothetical protein [Paenibacillus odorifer]OMD92744.1 hypothetical protein BSK67_18450 [Paenibacillus odorifer]